MSKSQHFSMLTFRIFCQSLPPLENISKQWDAMCFMAVLRLPEALLFVGESDDVLERFHVSQHVVRLCDLHEEVLQQHHVLYTVYGQVRVPVVSLIAFMPRDSIFAVQLVYFVQALRLVFEVKS